MHPAGKQRWQHRGEQVEWECVYVFIKPQAGISSFPRQDYNSKDCVDEATSDVAVLTSVSTTRVCNQEIKTWIKWSSFYESINGSRWPLKQSINSSKEAQQPFCFLKSSDQEIWNKTIKHHASTTFAYQKTRSQLQNASTVTRLLYINPKNYLIGHLKEAIRM